MWNRLSVSLAEPDVAQNCKQWKLTPVPSRPHPSRRGSGDVWLILRASLTLIASPGRIFHLPITLQKTLSVVPHQEFLGLLQQALFGYQFSTTGVYACSKPWICNEAWEISRMSPDPFFMGRGPGMRFMWAWSMAQPPEILVATQTPKQLFVTCSIIKYVYYKRLKKAGMGMRLTLTRSKELWFGYLDVSRPLIHTGHMHWQNIANA